VNGLHAAATGRIVADPEYRFTASGTALLTFRLAVEEHRQDGQQAETQFIGVSCFGERATELHDARRLAKGAECYAEGRLRLASWQGNDGAERHGLNLTAWTVTPMGPFGRTTPQTQGQHSSQRAPRGGYGQIVDGAGTRLPLPYDQEQQHAGPRR
jgi:single-strand DNA-binding protein